MVTLAQRIEELRTARGLSRPALAAALGFPRTAVAASSGGEGGTMFDAFLTSKKFQEARRTAVLDTLRTPEGQELLTKAIRKELANRQK